LSRDQGGDKVFGSDPGSGFGFLDFLIVFFVFQDFFPEEQQKNK